MLQQSNARNQNPEQDPQPSTPRAAVDPALQAKLTELDKLMPKTAAECGTAQDKALAFVEKQLNSLIPQHTPDRTEQFRLLQAAAKKTGGVTDPEYQKVMERFAENARSGQPGILPEPLESARVAVQQAKLDAKPGSTARERLGAADPAAVDTALPGLMRMRYAEALKAIHDTERTAPAPRSR